MNIPIFDIKRTHKVVEKDIEKQLKKCFQDHLWVLGPQVSLLEEAVKKYLGVKHAVSVASGTDALILSLAALAIRLNKKPEFKKNQEIITTPFTFIATGEAIMHAGAKPVFVDIDKNTFNINPAKIEKAITKNTVGILPVHMYGHGCDMNEIKKIANKHKLFIVEDVAQSFGAGLKQKKLGSFGDCGAYSFFPTKTLGGYGDGGMVVTNNNTLAKYLKTLRIHGQHQTYNASILGFNSRLDNFQAAVLNVKLPLIDKFNKMRKDIAKKYSQAFKNIKEVTVPKPFCKNAHIYSLYTIRVSKKRDQLLKYLNDNGIGARIYYPVALNKMKVFEGAKVKGKLSEADECVKTSISLPIYPYLKDKEINYIIEKVINFFKNN